MIIEKRKTFKSILVVSLTLGAVFLLITLSSCNCQNQKKVLHVTSPNKHLKVNVQANDGRPVYSVAFKGEEILSNSSLGIEFRKPRGFTSNLELKEVQREKKDHTYDLIAGKSDSARNHYKEMSILFQGQNSSRHKLQLVFRAYNDGIAFRYRFPKQNDLSEFHITREQTGFCFSGDYTAWAADYGSYNTSQEKEFEEIRLSSIRKEDIIGLPLTIQRKDGITLAITEADLENYAGMYLGGGDTLNALTAKLAPLPDSSGVLVRGQTPFETPWRVIMIGEDAGDLITSNIIVNLNDPSKIQDPSWIKAGKVVFPWWPDYKTNNPQTSGIFNYENQKYYIDFAAEHDIPYLELEPPWYGWGRESETQDQYDITEPVPELKMDQLLKYADKKDVRFLVWMHWKSLEKQMEEAMETYQRWGASGIKVDYMNRDDQQMVDFYHKVAKKAAEHHLLVYYHGAYKPTGLRRTWPNVLSWEGVLGLEYDKWGERVTPEHDVTIPFTRMLAGPMDYTPGGFDNATKESFKISWSDPMVMGTRCHTLAKFVVYESPLQMVADHPSAIRNKPGAQFIKKVPASWDETRYLKGKIGDYIALARRKDKKWFVGALTDRSARELQLPLSFLKKGKYKAVIYEDGPNAEERPKEVKIIQEEVNSKDKINVKLASGGGFSAYFIPLE